MVFICVKGSKLINTASQSKVPPISPAAINLQPKSIYENIENLNLAIQSAKAIGCIVVNISPQLVMEKREHIILGLIWQIIKVNYLSSIDLYFQQYYAQEVPGDQFAQEELGGTRCHAENGI